MPKMTLGCTGITVERNGFGALPIQRVDMDTAVNILHRAYDGGMDFYDTARAYSDSEEKLGRAFEGMRDSIVLASKTMANTPENFWKDLDTTLTNLKTDHLDIYQLHCVPQCYRPNDGTGMYECLEEAKKQGKILHIGITAHKIGVAEEIVESGLYESIQFPFSYLSGDREIKLVKAARDKNMCFIAMKALSGGLITNAAAAGAWLAQFSEVIPIWGIQKQSELDEFLAQVDNVPELTPELMAVIEKDRKELAGNFCRGCGYCMPCPQGIVINQSARISLMLRRAPAQGWLSEQWQTLMDRVDNCTECGLCRSRCPYGLDVPQLLKENRRDYLEVLSGNVSVY